MSLVVSASGNPPPSYQWFFNGSPLVGATDPTLRLFNVRATHQGAYSVVVRNLDDEVMSDDAVLTVLAAPTGTGKPDIEFYAGLGSNYESGPNNVVNALAVQPDGRILIAGNFTSYSGVPRRGLARVLMSW
mgnify:CR=1 FL=1